jgi:O-methyltransferase
MTLITEDRINSIVENLEKTKNVEGDIIEVGVYKGGSLKKIAEHAKSWCKRIIGYDTFTGIPEHTFDLDKNLIGLFSDTSIEGVRQLLTGLPVELVKGEFKHEGHEMRPVSFAHLDVDTYQSNVECLRFLLPRMRVGTTIVVDDYGYDKTPGVAIAVHGFLNAVDKRVVVEARIKNQIAIKCIKAL